MPVLDQIVAAGQVPPARLVGWVSATANQALLPPAVADVGATETTPTPRAPYSEPAAKPAPGLAIPASYTTDFLYRVHVRPAALQVSSPVEGAPIEFQVWNAYPAPNVLDQIEAEGADGLELTFTLGATWRAWEERAEGVIVTRSAPPIVSAVFLFDFREGDGRLAFDAERATVIRQHAQVPIVERLEWQTDLLRSLDGRVQRVSVRRHPRRRLSFKIVPKSEQEIRELAVVLASKTAAPVVLPVWSEPCRLTGAASGSSVFCDVSLSELSAGDSAWIERADRSDGELVRVESVDRGLGLVTLSDPLVRQFEAGDVLYPCVSAYLPDGSGLARRRVNVATATIEATVDGRAPLVGHGATVPTYDGLPLLDRRPAIERDAAESYALNFETIDFGGAIRTAAPEPVVTVKRPRLYDLADQSDLQFWRAFLAAVRGQSREFYTPTFRPNFVAVDQPTPGAAELLVAAEPDTFSFWMDLSNRKDIYIERADGAGIIRRVSSYSDQGDGTIRVSFTSSIAEAGDPPIVSLSMLERARLGSDTVEITHLAQGARLALTIETGRVDGADL